MKWRQCIELWVSMMQDQKSLTLHGPSSLGGGRAIVAAIYTHKRGQHFYYSLLSLNSCLIVQMQELISSILRWCSFLGHSSDVHGRIYGLNGGQYFDYVSQQPWMFWLSDSQARKSWTHHWRSFPGWLNERVTLLFTYKTQQFNHFGRVWLCRRLLAEYGTTEIVDSQLMLNLITYYQSVDAQQLDVKMHIVVIGS